MVTPSACSSTSSRASNAQLKRAAGSQSVAELRQAIATGWTADEINIQEGKSALHIAAWKGCLENVQYLIEDVGCDINAYSTGEFNYGKTAIFYACTQSRVDVVEYLLNRGAKVTVVNNKGQSVLSLCATHEMPERILQKIQQLEQEQGDWWNFRETHSDGLEYGDLDPRFLTRRLDTDVFTKYAVNPTSKKTRKGGFARRNPKTYEALTNRKQPPKKQRNQQKRRRAAELTHEEKKHLRDAWEFLQSTDWGEAAFNKQHEIIHTIISLNDKQMKPWLPEAADRLTRMEESGVRMREELIATLDRFPTIEPDQRLGNLAEKLLSRLRGEEKGEPTANGEQRADNKKEDTTQNYSSSIDWESEPWRSARAEINSLSISTLEIAGSPVLQLPDPPVMVDTLDQLIQLKQQLQSTSIVALDTEWYDLKDNRVAVATIQFAYKDPEKNTICTQVVDLLVNNELYRKEAADMIQNLFASPDIVLLGFAFGNDLPLLESFVGKSLQSNCFLDVQKLLAGKARAKVPGLRSCAARFSSVLLSKEQQCSDWAHRPLSQPQLEYAGLDACVLLFLVAEHLNSTEDR